MNGLKNKAARAGLMAGGAIMALAAGGYGQRANAQMAGCADNGGGNIYCSGAITTGQSINGNSLTITTSNDFSINSAANDAISVTSLIGDVSLIVTGDGDIVGQSDGLDIDVGYGIYINTGGAVRGVDGDGIELTSAIGGDVTVVTGSVSGGRHGIVIPPADAQGRKSVNVTVNGDLDGATGNAFLHSDSVYAEPTSLTVNGSSTSADGIFVRTPGHISIAVTGDVSATAGTGVEATGAAASYDSDAVLVDVDGDITATQFGVDVSTASSGGIRVYTDGDVTSTYTGGMRIDAIRARHTGASGTGGVYIRNSGTVTANGGNGVTVYKSDNYYGAYVTLNDVDASQNGIVVSTGAGVNSRVSVNNVTAGQTGVQFISQGGVNYNNLSINGSIMSGGYDVLDDEGRTSVTLNKGGSLNGNVGLGSYEDTFVLSGGDMTGAGVIDGGGEGATDSFRVTLSSDVIGSRVQRFENFNVDAYGWKIGKNAEQLPDPMVAQFAEDDTLTLDGSNSSVFVGVNSILSSGDTLTINAANGVTLNGPQNIYEGKRRLDMGMMEAEPIIIGTLDGGLLRTGGTPGASTITVNAANAYQGVTGSGTIDMRNGAVGDRVQVNGAVNLYGPDGADVLRVDIDPAVPEGDLLTVRDNVALSGNIDVNVINVTRTGVTDHVVVRTTDGVIFDVDAVTAAEEGGPNAAPSQPITASTDSVAAEVEARIEENEVIVQVTTDFTPPVDPEEPEDPSFNDTALSANGFTFGEYLNKVLDDPALADVRALALSATSIEELEALYQRLNGADFHAPLVSSFQGGTTFGAGLFSCAVGEGQFAAIDEGQCGWTRISGLSFDRDGSPGNPGVNESIFGVSAGGQMIVNENIRLGAGFGFETVDSDGDGGLDFNGDRIHAGVSAKYVEGNFMAGVSVGGGVTFGDTERGVGGGAVAEGSFDTIDFSVLARAAFLADLGDGFYAKPQIQGGVTYVDREGFTETGGGAANLQVMSESKTYLSLSPSVEFGGDFAMDGGMTLRPYIRLGATFLSEDDVDTTARFAASGSNATFTTTVARDDVFGQVNAGVVIFSEDDLSVRAEYQGQFSDDTESHGGFLKVQIRF